MSHSMANSFRFYLQAVWCPHHDYFSGWTNFSAATNPFCIKTNVNTNFHNLLSFSNILHDFFFRLILISFGSSPTFDFRFDFRSNFLSVSQSRSLSTLPDILFQFENYSLALLREKVFRWDWKYESYFMSHANKNFNSPCSQIFISFTIFVDDVSNFAVLLLITKNIYSKHRLFKISEGIWNGRVDSAVAVGVIGQGSILGLE